MSLLNHLTILHTLLLTLLLPLPLHQANTIYALTMPNAGLFNITDFSNTGSPHSLSARISFGVSSASCSFPSHDDNNSNSSSSAPILLANVECYYTQSVEPTIATTPASVSCSNESFWFEFIYASAGNGGGNSSGNGDGYYLGVTHMWKDKNMTLDSGRVYMGRHVETVVDPLNPNGNFQRLVHDSDFQLGFNRVVDCC